MKKLFMIAAVAALGFGMASCAKEGTTPDNNEGKSGLLQIKLTNGKSAVTRADSDPTESVVNVLEVWVFNEGGTTRSSGADGYVNYQRIEDPGFSPNYDGSYGEAFNVEGGEKEVLVIANANLGEQPTLTMVQLMGIVADQQFTKANNKTIFGDSFVMAGWNLNVDIDGDTECEVQIDRNVAKVAIPQEIATGATSALTLAEWQQLYPAASLTAIPDDFEFEMTGFAVLNGLPKSAVGFPYTTRTADAGYVYQPGHIPGNVASPFAYSNEWTGWNAGTYTLPTPSATWQSQITATNGATETALGARLLSTADGMMDETTVSATTMGEWAPYSGWMGTPGTAVLAPVYVHESKPGVMTNNTDRGYNHDQVVSVIIGGTIDATYEGDALPTVTRYWRVNIRSNNNEAYHFIRNSIYTTGINTIATIGHATPWEAENEDPIIDVPGENPTDFVISINEWNDAPVGNNEL